MRKRILAVVAASIFMGIGSAEAQTKQPHNSKTKSAQAHWRRPPNSPQEKLDDIIERLARLEAAMDAPSTSATFCISQGRGLEIKGKYAAAAKTELDLGVGWPNVAWAKANGKVEIPLVLFLGPIPIPIPNELGIELGGGHGRNFDICVDIPIALSPGDQARLLAVSETMNDPDNLGETLLDKGKFQRRAARAINYACRKVGGLLQCPLLPNLPLAASGQSAADDADQEFDRSDGASENLLEGGFSNVQEGLQAFKDGNVSELLASLELPSNVRSVLEDPEAIFQGMPNLAGGLPSCDSLQITAAMRARVPVLNSLCAELGSLPDADLVKGAFTTIDQLSDEVLDALAEIVGPLLNNVGEAPQNTKSRFCNSAIGQRRVFNRFCGRS